jgi:hypothetical protein
MAGMIRTDSEPEHLSADDQTNGADSCGDRNPWWIRWVAQLRFFPITQTSRRPRRRVATIPAPAGRRSALTTTLPLQAQRPRR